MNQTSRQLAEVLEQQVINSLLAGKGIYAPCDECGEYTQKSDLYSFDLSDDEGIKVCLKCHTYLTDKREVQEDMAYDEMKEAQAYEEYFSPELWEERQ